MSNEVKKETLLRKEISHLGKMLGDIIREIAGSDSMDIVEELRRLAWNSRSGRSGAEQRLTQYIASLQKDQLRVVVRAFSLFLDLMNLAEDRERVRVLRERKHNAYPNAHGESIGEAIDQLQQSGKSASEMQAILEHLHVELVFTAHPTEAKRRTVRAKLRKIRELLNDSDAEQLPREQERTQQLIRAELAKLWQTDVIRPWRPSVMQEVERGLSIRPVLWKVLPQIMREVRSTLAKTYPEDEMAVRPCVTFGSWIGGDRDGHPGVTTEITRQTFVWLRQAALELHLSACDRLFSSISLSERQMQHGNRLTGAVTKACKLWPPLKKKVSKISPDEACRQWIGVIRWRLEQTQQVALDNTVRKEADQDTCEGAYESSGEFADDVTLLFDAIAESPGGDYFTEEIQTWIDRIDVFGFHLARLDVRQDARQYRDVSNELLQTFNLAKNPESLDETQRQKILLCPPSEEIRAFSQSAVNNLSEESRDTLDLFRLLHQVVESFGLEALGGHVISMASTPSDVLTVLWLWKLTEPELKNKTSSNTIASLPIVPLFETIEDLEQGPTVLANLLGIAEYREHLSQQNDHQIVMLGYSDSTKTGGYLSACWSLHEAQQELHDAAAANGITLDFFHGRGGSLGRGGGPAARGILSLPAGTFDGALRLTEQGEVLAERYDDPTIAHRHLEQVVWSSLLASGKPTAPDKQSWSDLMDRLADTSYHIYRELIERPNFVDYFRQATPLAEVEQLPMGSRPARRRGGNSLSDLRAIPWVFSWTQCRCLIPAWYGFGSAVNKVLEEIQSQNSSSPDSLLNSQPQQLLQSMYREWPFFRATIDNAELALAKTDLDIARQYATLTEDTDAHKEIEAMIASEFLRSRDAILMITEKNSLLENTPWLKESIRMRNRYIDPLNLIQIELLRRSRSCPEASEEQAEELRHLTRLTIKGLAAGMRTSG